MADSIEKQCKTCSHWQGTICEYRPWPTGEACADWEEGKPTSDLISRQTAITTLLKAYPLIQKEKLVRVMTEVPRAEAGDCISRQAAIDACTKAKVGAFPHDAGINNSIKALKALPSAQPHQKGKWINHRKDDGHNIADCDQCGNAIQWFDGDEIPRYCCTCGADMRGENE